MHSHVILTTAKNLRECLDEWTATKPNLATEVRNPAEVVGQVTPHHVGGRDWVVTVIHEHEPIPDHGRAGHTHEAFGTEDPAALDAIGRTDISIGSMVVGSAPSRVELDALRLERVAGGQGVLIEDTARTWALWTDKDGKPASMWLRRDADGGVEGVGIGFDGDRLFVVPDESTPYPKTWDTDREIPWSPPSGVQSEAYTNWAVRERNWFWNECVSARETLRVLGWPDADKNEVPIHHGITWLSKQGLASDGVQPRYRVDAVAKNPNEIRQSLLVDHHEVGGGIATSTIAEFGNSTRDNRVAHALATILTLHDQHPTALIPDEPIEILLDAIGNANAYTDATAALYEVTRAPLSTTLGHLIRQGWLRPSHPRGKFFVRWENGGITVDGVPVPGEPGKWDLMRYIPQQVPETVEAKRGMARAVTVVIEHLTGQAVDEAVLAD